MKRRLQGRNFGRRRRWKRNWRCCIGPDRTDNFDTAFSNWLDIDINQTMTRTNPKSISIKHFFPFFLYRVTFLLLDKTSNLLFCLFPNPYGYSQSRRELSDGRAGERNYRGATLSVSTFCGFSRIDRRAWQFVRSREPMKYSGPRQKRALLVNDTSHARLSAFEKKKYFWEKIPLRGGNDEKKKDSNSDE